MADEHSLEEKFESILFLPEGENRQGEGGLRTKGFFKKTYENKPLISVITVVYNGKRHLEETIQSVINQTYDNVEYIIIDGGSTDGTLDIIKKYEDKIDYWVSEKDQGIYDAMNKGLKVCQGAIVGIINSDDWYEDVTLELVSKYFNQNEKILLFSNMVAHMRGGYDIFHTALIPLCKEDVRLSRVHPTVFISTKAYQHVGLFDTSFNVAADFDLMVRMYLNNVKIIKIDRILVHFRDGGVSSQGLGGFEEFYIAKKHKFNLKTVMKIFVMILFVKIKNLIKRKVPFSKKVYRYFINEGK